jgi:hypothetical protein
MAVPEITRKPLTKLETKETYTVRFKPSEWSAFETSALASGIEVRRYVRECTLTGHSVEEGRRLREGHTRVSA